MNTTLNVLWTGVALLVVVLGLPSSSAGQGCRDEETISVCWERLLRPNADAEKKAQQDAPRKTETGLADVAGLSSSVKDFVPLLQLTGVLGAVQKDEQTGAVTVALNTPFLGSTRSEDKTDNALQLKAVIETSAKLFAPLKQQIPEGDRAAVERQLLGSREDAENVTLHASYNFSSRRLGRNFARHADTLNALFDRAMAGQVRVKEQALGLAIAQLAALIKADISRTRWSDMTAADRAVVMTRLGDIVRQESALDAEYAARRREMGLDVYGQLVLNQPQLQMSASRSFRDDLFGPDLIAGRISFEMGLGNSLNAALGPFNGTCAAMADACLARYAAFLKDPQTRAAIKDGSRMSFWIEFARNDAYHFRSTGPDLELAIAEGTGWTGGVDYGRLIAVQDDGTAGGRIDGAIRWESAADETVDERFVASLTITKKLGDLSVPFGIVYANKPKYLTGVDQGLSATVGLKFNLFPALN
jgi:hypothetical protein